MPVKTATVSFELPIAVAQGFEAYAKIAGKNVDTILTEGFVRIFNEEVAQAVAEGASSSGAGGLRRIETDKPIPVGGMSRQPRRERAQPRIRRKKKVVSTPAPSAAKKTPKASKDVKPGKKASAPAPKKKAAARKSAKR